MRRLAAMLLASAVAIAAAAQPDRIFVNANIYTVDEGTPRAQALAIAGDRISTVGANAEVRATAAPDTIIVDCEGKTIVPGFIDCHGHLEGLGSAIGTVDLVGTKSYEEIIDRVRSRAKNTPTGQWIVGRGWDQNDWPDTAFPHHAAVSEAMPDHPVHLVRVDGHAALVNRKALDAARIRKNTPDPPGGRIIRDDDGNATGVLIDAAVGLVAAHIPRDSPKQIRAKLLRAMESCARAGLTSVHDAGVTRTALEEMRDLAADDELPIRVYAMLRANDRKTLHEYFASGPVIGLGSGMLTIRSVKAMNDGALGSRGAALIEPYSDEPGSRGLTLVKQDALEKLTIDALKAGFQVCTHSIGDRANHETLNAYTAAIAATGAKDHRLRIEHAQVIAPDDIPRFARLNVIPSMQATHATSDMYWAEDRLGMDRVKGAYAWRSLMTAGCRIANGSDFPVENPNPLWGFYAAITRQDHEGWPEGGWQPDQRMTREEALRSFTLDAAYAAFEENQKGSIAPGKYADIVILSDDIMTIDPPAILKTHVDSVYIGGKPVFQLDNDRTAKP